MARLRFLPLGRLIETAPQEPGSRETPRLPRRRQTFRSAEDPVTRHSRPASWQREWIVAGTPWVILGTISTSGMKTGSIFVTCDIY
jgi:hypothetical protein